MTNQYYERSKPRRILMTCDTVGGVWTFAVELIRGLAEHDIEVILATMGAPLRGDQEHEISKLPNVLVHDGGFKLEWMEDPWEDIYRAGEWLLELRDIFCPELIHLNNYAPVCLDWDRPVILTAHSCVLSWWNAVRKTALPLSYRQYRSLVEKALIGADVVVSPTYAYLSELQKIYGNLPTGRVIPNGRSFWPLKAEKQPLIMAAGRLWDEAKNIQALAKVNVPEPWEIVVAGMSEIPGSERKCLQDEIGELRFCGQLPSEELVEKLRSASIYALPAKYEPFGLSILEAAMSECALVVGDIPTLHEVWEDAAEYVNPEDPGELEAALHRLIHNPSELRKRQIMARNRAMNYSTDQMVSSYVKLYQERTFSTEEKQRNTACIL